MREESEAKGFVLLSDAGVFEPEPDRVVSSRDVVPVVRIRCTR